MGPAEGLMAPGVNGQEGRVPAGQSRRMWLTWANRRPHRSRPGLRGLGEDGRSLLGKGGKVHSIGTALLHYMELTCHWTEEPFLQGSGRAFLLPTAWAEAFLATWPAEGTGMFSIEGSDQGLEWWPQLPWPCRDPAVCKGQLECHMQGSAGCTPFAP